MSRLVAYLPVHLLAKVVGEICAHGFVVSGA
jgi:hypothetical protein